MLIAAWIVFIAGLLILAGAAIYGWREKIPSVRAEYLQIVRGEKEAPQDMPSRSDEKAIAAKRAAEKVYRAQMDLESAQKKRVLSDQEKESFARVEDMAKKQTEEEKKSTRETTPEKEKSTRKNQVDSGKSTGEKPKPQNPQVESWDHDTELLAGKQEEKSTREKEKEQDKNPPQENSQVENWDQQTELLKRSAEDAELEETELLRKVSPEEAQTELLNIEKKSTREKEE